MTPTRATDFIRHSNRKPELVIDTAESEGTVELIRTSIANAICRIYLT